MTDGETQRSSFSFTKRSACYLPKCTTSIKKLCAVADFSKWHIQMLISAPRDDTEWNSKTSRMPAFRDGTPFFGDITFGLW